MKNQNLEVLLRNYFTKENGKNLKKINKDLKLIEPEYVFQGGRIDILCEYKKRPLALELKANNYSTQMVCVQLLNYINYVKEKKGSVIFLAPKVKYGVYSTLKEHYSKGILELYEFDVNKNYDLNIKKMSPKLLDDSRNIQYLNEFLEQESLKESLEDVIYKNAKEKKYSDKAKAFVNFALEPGFLSFINLVKNFQEPKPSFFTKILTKYL